MLTVSNLAMAFHGRPLFQQATFQINPRDRLGVVGPNGAGKTTLFSILLSDLHPDEGQVVLERGKTIGHLSQETAETGDETVLDLALAVSPEHGRLRRIIRLAEAAGDFESPEYLEAREGFAELDGYQLEPKAKRILNGLAFRESDFHRPAAELSGGWIMRAHLARLLVMEPDLLMLDEPTNHLDLESLGWFQNYLKSYPGAILMISHDRAFLNTLTDGILEVRAGRIELYRGNYDRYLEQRAAREEQQWAAYKNQQREIATLQRFADRFRAKASKASQAQSKLKQIERMEKIEAPDSQERTVGIRFPQPPRSGQKAITLENVHHAYGDHVVYRGIDFQAERGQRIVLVGPNGAGKSTLLKLLAGVLPVQKGERITGHNVKTGYYSQNRVEMLEPSRTVLQEVLSLEHPPPEQTARTVLGSFLFTGDNVFKTVGVLSGGEKSRLALAKLLLDPPNLLLMDEPTTHLDMASIDALIEALAAYEGTLVFISHDVYFIRALAKTVLHIDAGRLTLHAGDYDYYLERSGAGSEQAGLIAAGQEPAQAGMGDHRPPANSSGRAERKPSIFKSKEQKRREAEERQARSKARKEAGQRARQLESRILELEERQKSLAAQLEDPAVYEPGGEAVKLNRELSDTARELAHVEQEWEEALRQLEKLEENSAKEAVHSAKQS